MKLFILEDDPIRIEKFKTMFSKHDVDLVENAQDGIRLLNENKYDYIFLDHDLGGEQMVDSYEDNTGYTVAKEIPNGPNSGTPIIIHSFNPIGAANMKSILPGSRRMPFGTFNESVLG